MAVEDRLLKIVQDAADGENFARSTKEGKVTVEAKLIGDRPAGSTDVKSELVQAARAAIEAGGYKVVYGWSSTDSNMPMSLGIPAIMYTSLLHVDYHTPRDEPQRIDYRKLLHMTQWMYLTGWAVANRTAPPAREPGFKLER